MTEFTVTVRDLVAFCHRSGDIDHRFTPSPTGEQGVEGHQRVYRRRPDSYLSEYAVEYLHRGDGPELLIRGRADGYDPAAALVEEIKTCRVSAHKIPDSVSRLHLAQGRLYAALIAIAEDLPQLEVRLTWFNIDSGAEHPLSQTYSREELAQFLADTLARFSGWLQLLARRRQQRDASLAWLDFPHGEFRSGQRDIAELVYKCIDQGGRLMLEAPTGMGKTAAVMFPALKALATGKHDRIVYLTAKNVGRRAAEDTLRQFTAAGMSAPALSLTAAERICFSPGKACNGEDCLFARGYYDRRGQAMHRAIQADSLARADIEAIAREIEVCPYQLSLDLLPWVDLVIADIHYLYSLTAILAALMAQDGLRWTALLDEAHNLPGRARRMYSATLAKDDLMALKKQAPSAIRPALEKINRAMLALNRETWTETDFDSRAEIPATLTTALREFVAATGENLVQEPSLLAREPALGDFYFEVLQFLRVADNWGEEFRFELSTDGSRQGLVVTLNCLDPGRLLGQKHSELAAAVAFSATLSPRSWMRGTLGLAAETVYRRQPSPFASDQLQVYLATSVDTRYRQRQQSLGDLAALIRHWLESQPGNCILYFPSYRYLEDCLRLLRERGLDELERSLWVQQRGQDDAARDSLLDLLGAERNVAAFCILGGIFGEGVDLPGNQLSSVVVVGVGLPQYNRDTEQLRAYFQQKAGAGFDYAYLYPGMQKVDQALGRVVRRPEDRGKALLIDSRYALDRYRQLLPPWWNYQPAPAPKQPDC